MTLATAWIRLEVLTNLVDRPWSLIVVTLSMGGFGAILWFLKEGRELPAFLASSGFLLGLVAATMIGNYPFWLRSTLDPAFSLSAANTASASHGLRMALAWWLVGIALAGAYFLNLYRSIRGKVEPASMGEGH